jgi:hypothetical protein
MLFGMKILGFDIGKASIVGEGIIMHSMWKFLVSGDELVGVIGLYPSFVGR